MSQRSSIERLLDRLAEAVIMVNEKGQVEFLNTQAEKFLGYRKAELTGQNINVLLEPKHHEIHSRLVHNFVHNQSQPKRMLSRPGLNCLAKGGEKLRVRISISVVTIRGIRYGIGIISDFTEMEQWQQELEKQSNTDQLTSLYNRRYLEHTLRPDSRWLRQHSAIGVLNIDLDNFKEINDNHGHYCGDLVLRTLATRMKDALRTDDLLFRMGGDEFLILINLDECPDPHDTISGIAIDLARNISAPVHYEDHALQPGASIGIGVYPDDVNDLNLLILMTDDAMYRAKKQGNTLWSLSDSLQGKEP